MVVAPPAVLAPIALAPTADRSLPKRTCCEYSAPGSAVVITRADVSRGSWFFSWHASPASPRSASEACASHSPGARASARALLGGHARRRTARSTRGKHGPGVARCNGPMDPRLALGGRGDNREVETTPALPARLVLSQAWPNRARCPRLY